MKPHPVQQVGGVQGEYVGVDLGALDGAVAQQLANVLERTTVQHQVDGERVPERVRSDPEWRPANTLQ